MYQFPISYMLKSIYRLNGARPLNTKQTHNNVIHFKICDNSTLLILYFNIITVNLTDIYIKNQT